MTKQQSIALLKTKMLYLDRTHVSSKVIRAIFHKVMANISLAKTIENRLRKTMKVKPNIIKQQTIQTSNKEYMDKF